MALKIKNFAENVAVDETMISPEIQQIDDIDSTVMADASTVDQVEAPVVTPEAPIVDSSTAVADTTTVDTPKPLEINEELIISYLRENRGIEASSLDDLLSPKPAVEVEEDPYIKELKGWRDRTGRPIQDWIKYSKNYDSVAPEEIAREYLQTKYPEFTPEEINAELMDYQPSEDDMDHEVSRKQREFKKLVIEGKNALKNLAVNLNQPSNEVLPVSVKQDLDLLNKFKAEYAKSQEGIKGYKAGIQDSVRSTKALPLTLSDNMKIDFILTEQDQKSLPSYIENIPHWKNADGSDNHQAIVSDAIKIKYFDKLIALAHEQGIEKGKEAILTEGSNSTVQTKTTPLGVNDGKGIKVDQTLDEYFGKSRTLKFGRKY